MTHDEYQKAVAKDHHFVIKQRDQWAAKKQKAEEMLDNWQ